MGATSVAFQTSGSPRRLTRRNQPAARQSTQKRFGARRTIDGQHFQRLPSCVDGGMEKVRWDVNEIARRDRLPPLAADIDHLVPLSGHHVENLFTARVIVPLVPL